MTNQSSSKRRCRRVGALLLTVGALTAAACSSDSETVDDSVATTAAPASTGAPAPDTTGADAPETTAASVVPEGTLRVAVDNLGGGGGLADMEPARGITTLSLVQDHLIRAAPDGSLLPSLAKEWEVAEDGSSITFHLQEGVQFHDGWGEFTSADVKFTIDEIIANDASPSVLVNLFENVVESVETPDKYTVVFNIIPGRESFDILQQIDDNFPVFPIASKAYVESVGRDGASAHWIGTGPWKFVEFKAGEILRLEAVENHWRQTPAFKELEVLEVPEPATQALMLEAGDVDIISAPVDSIDQLEDAGFDLLTTPGHPLYMFFGGMYLPTRESFDPTLPWVADPADAAAWDRARLVRQALNHAVDKDAIVEGFLGEESMRTVVPGMSPEHLGYDPSWEDPYPYDPDRARELLEEAGYPDGFEMSVILFRLSGREVVYDISQAAAEYFSDIGIDVKIETPDYSTVISPAQRARELRSIGTYGVYQDEAMTTWYLLSHSEGGAMWLLEHPDVDEIIERGQKALDEDERAAITQELAQWYMDEAVSIPLGTTVVTFAVNPDAVGAWPLVPAQLSPAVNLEYITKP